MEKEISKKEIEHDVKEVCYYLEFYDNNGHFPFEIKSEIITQ
jgi:hypothetical protein